MNKLALAAILAISVSMPAHAASVRVPLKGKTQEQIRADIDAASRKVCRKQALREGYRSMSYPACYRETVKTNLQEYARTYPDRAPQLAER